MIDFHSHVLPGIDDGAMDADMSIDMLRRSMDTGVTTVVATSHCYPYEQESISRFLKNRKEAYDYLCAKMKESKLALPKIITGCEVHVIEGVSKLENLEALCIENTNYLLLEMPYEPWTEDIFEEVYHVTRRGIRPIMAHLDRYISQKDKFSDILSLDVLVQINASSFIEKKYRKELLKWFRSDSIHVIGTDMHNMTSRPPNLKEAYDIIEKKYGWEYVDFLKNSSRRILENKVAIPTRLPKPNLIKQIML